MPFSFGPSTPPPRLDTHTFGSSCSSTKLPRIRDVLGDELCDGDLRPSANKSYTHDLQQPPVLMHPMSAPRMLGPFSSISLQTPSPSKTPTRRRARSAVQPYSSSLICSSREDPFLTSSPHSSSSMLPVILQRMKMDDEYNDHTGEGPSSIHTSDVQRLPSQLSWESCAPAHHAHYASLSRLSISERAGPSRSQGGRIRHASNRSLPRGDCLLMKETAAEQQPSAPISIPEPHDEYHPRSLSRSFSSYSAASGTSEGFPYTPKMGTSEISTDEERGTGLETLPRKSPMQVSSLLLPEDHERSPNGPFSLAQFYGEPSSSAESRPSETEAAISIPNKNFVCKSKPSNSHAGKFECSYCQKRFSRPSSLRTHIHSHTGEKPYRCDVPGCGRCFSVHSNLRRHQKNHSLSSLTPIIPVSYTHLTLPTKA